MRLGIVTVDTTPEVGTYLGGFARMRDSNGVRDRLETTVAWAESDAGDAVALVCADLVFIHRELTAALRTAVRSRLGERVNVEVACSHSHATPYGTFGAPERRFQRYSNRWLQLATEAIVDARRVAVPGHLCWRTTTHAAAINRRLPGPDGRVDFGWNEAGPVDDRLAVVELVDEAGSTMGLIVSAALHPICLPPWSRRASADWVGEMRRAIRTERDVPIAFVQGACADVNPRHEWVPRRFGPSDVRGPHAAETNDAACVAIGRLVAEAAVGALSGDGEFIPDGPVGTAGTSVPMSLRPRAGHDGNSLGYWRAVVGGKPLPRFLADALLNRAFPWKTPVIDQQVGLDVSVTRIGGLAVIAHGSEPFAETGIAARRDAPTPFTLFAGYSNGMIGYVPTDFQIPLGGYEVEMVPALYRLPGNFAPGNETAALRASLRLASELWNR